MTTNINRIASYLVLASVLSLGGCAWWEGLSGGGGDKPPSKETIDAAYRAFNEEQERATNAVSNADSEYRKALSGKALRDREANKACASKIKDALDTFEKDVRNKYQSVSGKGNAFLRATIAKVIAGEQTTPEFKSWADKLVEATDELVSYSSNNIATDGSVCGGIQQSVMAPAVGIAIADALVNASINIWKAYKSEKAEQRKAKAAEMEKHYWPSWDIITKAKFSNIKSSS